MRTRVMTAIGRAGLWFADRGYQFPAEVCRFASRRLMTRAERRFADALTRLAVAVCGENRAARRAYIDRVFAAIRDGEDIPAA